MSALYRLRRRALLASATGTLAAPFIVRAQGQNGVALVIGNSKYKWEASLPNAKSDAADVARTFEAMGLKTNLVNDAGRAEMLEAQRPQAFHAPAGHQLVIWQPGEQPSGVIRFATLEALALLREGVEATTAQRRP